MEESDKVTFLGYMKNSKVYRSTSHVRIHAMRVVADLAMMGQGFVFIMSPKFFDWPHAPEDVLK